MIAGGNKNLQGLIIVVECPLFLAQRVVDSGEVIDHHGFLLTASQFSMQRARPVEVIERVLDPSEIEVQEAEVVERYGLPEPVPQRPDDLDGFGVMVER